MPIESLVPADWNLPESIRQRLGDQVGRQRAMQADGHVLLVLHQPPEPDEVHRRGALFWRSPEGKWKSSAYGDGPAALEKHLASFAQRIGHLDRQEDEARSAAQYFELLEALAPVLRAARNLHHTLQEARQMLPGDRNLLNFRDMAYEIERTAELLYNDAKNALEYAVARRAEEQAESSRRMAVAAHRLNLLAAFFFPIATLTAIFGMSLPNGLEAFGPPWPFVAVVGAGLVMGMALTLFVTRRG
jgi:hypothetical protein